MKVTEIFETIQGEGRFAGYPVLFIRLSGCNRKCSYCDTKYHKIFKNMTVKQINSIIKKSKKRIVVWSGGEPTVQYDEMRRVIDNMDFSIDNHLETNGDILIDYSKFDYVSVSPKTIKSVLCFLKKNHFNYDIKVVTDLKTNENLIKYATMLMPLTTFNNKKDKKIKQDVWKYCVEHNIRFSLRQHIEVFGYHKRSV